MVTVKLIRSCIKKCFVIGLWVFAIISFPVLSASLTATLDRQSVEFGRSIDLTITARDLDGEIDFSPLQQHFEILGTSRSKNVRIVNGQMDATLTWQLSLMPLTTGKLEIPTLELNGVTSAPVKLEVTAVGESSGQPESRDFILELSVDNDSAYVQQQFVVTARIYQARSILEGSLTDPTGDNIIFERLGSDKTYAGKKNRREYSVIERHYAVFAQKSGPLTLKPLRLVATVRKAPGGSNQGFFSNTEKIHVISNELTIDIKPRPAGGQSAWWLPAETLNLTAQWSGDINSVRVNEPITRKLMLSAKGVHSTQLPELQTPAMENAKIYPDQAETTTRQLNQSIVSYRTDKWAFIPQKSGPLQIPELRFEWFDTVNNQYQEEVIPAETIEVLPAAVSIEQGQAHSAVPEENSANLKDSSDIQSESLNGSSTNTITGVATVDNTDKAVWIWILLGVVIGWLSLIAAMVVRRSLENSDTQRQQKIRRSPRVASLKEVTVACKQGDPKKINSAVIDWAADQWPKGRVRNLKSIVAVLKIEGTDLAAQLQQIDAQTYSSRTDEHINCQNLVSELRRAVKQSKAPSRPSAIERENDLLPEL